MPDRKTSWIVAVLLLTLGLFFVLVLYGAYRLMRPGQIEITQKSVLEVDLGGAIAELPSSSSLARLLDKDAVSIVDMDRAFRAAAKDPQITSVFLSIHPLGMPWAQVEELRDFLKEFKKSGKSGLEIQSLLGTRSLGAIDENGTVREFCAIVVSQPLGCALGK